jgi:hypothetical protein
MVLAIFFRRSGAALWKMIGVFTIFASIFFFGDGYILTPIILIIAGGFLVREISPHNTSFYEFSVKIIYFGIMFIAGMVYFAP